MGMVVATTIIEALGELGHGDPDVVELFKRLLMREVKPGGSAPSGASSSEPPEFHPNKNIFIRRLA